MSKQEILVSIDNQTLKLTNLDKLLFPQSGIIKAELIEYYKKISEFMLPHIQNRPITLIRYPDGIDEEKFYSKNKADWAPEWIKSVKLPDHETDYLIDNDKPTLIWMANLSAIEIHSMTLKTTNFLPDVFIFDLDPSEGISFDDVKAIAWELKNTLIKNGYNPFLKTSGSKGLHIYVPIEPNYTSEQVVEKVKSITMEFITKHPNTTLQLRKEHRIKKIFIDIYRNRSAQTCVSPYSVRGIENAPVSTPIFWDNLSQLSSSQQYNIKNIFDYLEKNGEPWANINENKTELTPNLDIKASNSKLRVIDIKSASNNVEELLSYSKKRNFSKTNEPLPEINTNKSGKLKYVIQKHDATNLHYDLRLEYDGVLLSWAIPKSLPILVGEKRMAVQTEPHPMKYLTFEGKIPKEQYGGGEMWVFDTGEVTYLKKEENKIKFILSEGKISGQFKLYHTDGNKWLLERMEDGIQAESISIKPMLASLAGNIPTKNNYFFEIKWDGIRVIVRKIGELVEIISRGGNNITDKFPEIEKEIAEIKLQNVVIDGEIVCLNNSGKPEFVKVLKRLHLTGEKAIQKAMLQNLSTCYLFDMLYIDGMDIRSLSIEKRRSWLEIGFKPSENLRFSESFENGDELFEAVKTQNMEGIICKKIGSPYQSNSRNNNWLKIKIRNIEESIIIGYTRGQGDRALLFGALLLGQYDNDILVYKGKVGTGFNEKKQKEILALIAEIPKTKKPIKEKIDEENKAVWIEPKLWCEIQFASITPNNTFREPVFLNIKEV